MFSTSSQSRRVCQTAAVRHIEPCESRRYLAVQITWGPRGDDLHITGTNGDDAIYVYPHSADPELVTISANGQFSEFALDDLGSLIVDAGGGNDIVEISYGEYTTLLGGAGDDVLRGGPNCDLLDGGAGADRLYAPGSRQVIMDAADNYNDGVAHVTGGVLHLSTGDEADDLKVVRNNKGVLVIGGRFGGAVQDLKIADTSTLTAIRIDAGAGDDSVQVLDYTMPAAQTVGLNIRLDGGAGDDTLVTAGGDDTLTGGPGNDSLVGGAGRDELDGGANAPGEYDVLLYDPADFPGRTWDGAGRAKLYSDGSLFISGTDADDQISVSPLPGDPSRLLVRHNGVEKTYKTQHVTRIHIKGGAGNDGIALAPGVAIPATLIGGDGSDTLVGGAASDVISGGGGDYDSISGNAGDDSIYGDTGHDTLFGNEGSDLLQAGSGNDDLDGGDGADILLGGNGDDNLAGGEVPNNGPSSSYYVGDEDPDLLYGQDGDDRLSSSGADTIYAGAGNDWAGGFLALACLGDGDDTFSGAGTVYGQGGNDTLSAARWGRGSFYGGEDDDTLTGSNEYGSRLDGGNGNDRLSSPGRASDSMYAGPGADTINAREWGEMPTSDFIDAGDDDNIDTITAQVTEYEYSYPGHSSIDLLANVKAGDVVNGVVRT